ncbi:MAG: hypothetical protein IKV70_00340, partial [Phascolarctobacterium sp.]|nr:hypothetical protein [Phascolarctobacterium sp.]
MSKLSSNKKAAILATVLGGWMLTSSSAMAANLIAGVPSDYTNSQLGAITGSYVTTHVDATPKAGVVTNLNRDPAVFNVNINGESKLFLRQYNYSTTALKPSYLIDSDGDWASSSNNVSGTIEKAPNAHNATAYGDFLYIADYDIGHIGVAKVTDSALVEYGSYARNLKQDIIEKCGAVFKSDYAWVHCEGVIAKDGYLYAMVSVNPEGSYYVYDDSYLIQYKINSDGRLEYTSHTRAGKNTDMVRMNLYNNMIMTTAIGGMQNYGGVVSGDSDSTVPGFGDTVGNVDTCISIGFINGGRLDSKEYRVVVPDEVASKGLDFRDMQVLPDGTAYVMTYNLSGSGGGSTMCVYKTTVTNLLSENPIDWEVVIDKTVAGSDSDKNGSGWFNKIFAEYYTKRVWAEIGDSLVVYTDGAATPTYTWLTKDFSTNKQLYKWNSVITISPDTVAGELATIVNSREEGLTASSVTVIATENANATNKKGDYSIGITGTEKDTVYSAVTKDNSVYTFTDDRVINLSAAREGDLSNNILAAIYANNGNDITVNADDNTLQLQVKNYISTPVGVFAGNGKNLTVNAGKLNIITSGLNGGNTLTNAIWLDPTQKGNGSITLNTDVNISMNGGYGGNGVAIQKTDRWGEASYTADKEASIVINGDVSIKGADSETWGIPINHENVFSRFNNAGILTSVEKSTVTVNGNVDFDVYGNGVTTNAKDSTVTINGGGKITVPSGMKYGYYTLASFLGTINMNTGLDGSTPGTDSVQLNGDVFALNTGNINLALTTSDSYLDGIVDNNGTVNLWLQNGANWINEANNARYKQDNEDVGSGYFDEDGKYVGVSKVTRFYGGDDSAHTGVIYQTANSNDLTIDNYSGYTKVLFEHDANNFTNILGGNVTIGNASVNSNITLVTDYANGMDNTEVQNEVLNALANKLYYSAYYKNGENNLTGTVAIAEGLTGSSVSKYVGNIAYSSVDGQGRLEGSSEPAPDVPEMPDIPVVPEKPDVSQDEVKVEINGETWDETTTGRNIEVVIKGNSTWTGNSEGDNLNANIQKSTWSGLSNGKNAQITIGAGAFWSGNNTGADADITLDGGNWTGNNTGNNAQVNGTGAWSGNNSGTVTVSGITWNGENTNSATINSVNWTGNNEGTAELTGGTWSGSNTGTANINGTTWNGDNNAKATVTITNGEWSGSNAGTATLNSGNWSSSNTGEATLNKGTWTGTNAGQATIAGGSWQADNSGTVNFNGGSWTGDNTAEGKVTVNADGWTGDN